MKGPDVGEDRQWADCNPNAGMLTVQSPVMDGTARRRLADGRDKSVLPLELSCFRQVLVTRETVLHP